MTESSLSPSEPVALPERPFGRVARSVFGYSVAAALMVITPLVVFVPAALFHCAIRNGRRAAWATMACSLAMIGAYFAMVPARTPLASNMAWSYLAGVVLAIALPAMIVMPLVERGEAFGRVLVMLILGGAIGLALTEIGSREVLSFSPYEAQLQEAARSNVRVAQFYRANGASPEVVRMVEKSAKYTAYVLPGFLLILNTLVFILSLMMLGRLQAWRDHAARRGDASMQGVYYFRNLQLPDWVLFAFILGGLTPLATGMVQKAAANTLFVVAFFYILQGLAIFRYVLVAMGAGLQVTLLAWMLLGILTVVGGITPLLLGVAGLFDPFFDLRQFKKRKDDSHESHSD